MVDCMYWNFFQGWDLSEDMTPNGWQSNAMAILHLVPSLVVGGWRVLGDKIIDNFYDLRVTVSDR